MTREELLVVEKQCFVNQSPRIDCDVIPGNSPHINGSNNYNQSDLDTDLYQAQATNIQQGSVCSETDMRKMSIIFCFHSVVQIPRTTERKKRNYIIS